MPDPKSYVSPPEQAVILCGGLGSRLGNLTRATPKPLLPVGERPFLDCLLGELKRLGFRRVLLLAAFEWQQVVEYARSATAAFGLDVSVSREPELAGTGGALHHALGYLDPTFLLLNGDSWFDFNWLDLSRFSAEQPSIAIGLALRQLENASRYGTVTVKDGRVTAFASRPAGAGPGLVNGGVYWVRRDLLATRLAPTCSLERDVLPFLVDEGQVAARVYNGFFLDIGVPEAFAEAQRSIPTRRRRPAVFLDRDGVLNEDTGYVGRREQFRWCEEAIRSVKRFNDAGLYVFIVSNQAGVARGLYTLEDVELLHEAVQDELRHHAAHVDDIRICPYHIEGCVPEYTQASNWRKPEPGMILDLLQSWPVDCARSVLVGDKQSDLDAAQAAGLPGILVGPRGLTLDVADRALRATPFNLIA